MATTITWLEPIADNYDPSTQQAQWIDILPSISLPEGKLYHMTKGSVYTTQQMLGAGCSHVNKFDLFGMPQSYIDSVSNAGRAYNDPMGNLTPQQFNLPDRGAGTWVPVGQGWPNIFNTRFFDYQPGQTEPLTVEQGTQKGNLQSTGYNMVIWENSEQDHAISSHWPFVRAYFDAFIDNMESRWGSKPFFVSWNYFSGIGGSIRDMGRANAKLWLRKNPNTWNADKPLGALGYPSGDMLPGGTLERTTMSCFGVYLGQPETIFRKLYDLVYSAALNKKCGKHLVAFVQGFHEWRPNNFYKILYPEGTFYQKQKLPININFVYSLTALSFIFGSGLIAYGYDTKRNDKKIVRTYSEGALWFNLAGESQSLDSFPHWTPEGGGYYTQYTGIADITAMAAVHYSQSWAPTEGGTAYFCDYSLDGGTTWTTAQNAEMDDVVDAQLDERGICYVRILGNKMSVLFIDPFGTNSPKTLVFRHPGNPTITYTQEVSTSIAHMCLQTI